MTNTNLLRLLPPYYAEIEDYRQICQAERPTFDEIKQEIMRMQRNFSPLTMDLEAIQEWEATLHILANPETETLDFRRYRIINRLSTKPPFTVEFLRRKLDELIGPGLWTLDVDYPNYQITIESSAQPQAYSQEVEFTINRIKPAHIVFMHRSIVFSEMAAGEEIRCLQYGWNYKLGAWNLGDRPFADLKKNEVIKTENIPSVQPALLARMLTFTSSNIAAARVNGNISISQIAKTIESGQLIVNYSVIPSQTNEITKVELLDEQGAVMTSSAVFIPVTDTVNVRHSITIRAGGNANVSN